MVESAWPFCKHHQKHLPHASQLSLGIIAEKSGDQSGLEAYNKSLAEAYQSLHMMFYPKHACVTPLHSIGIQA
jgi:hypothetical protein